jgi:hypothetical protein
MSTNPYEAPQTIAQAAVETASIPDAASWPGLEQVRQGAKHCYDAVLLAVGSLLIFFLIGVITGFLGILAPSLAILTIILLLIALAISIGLNIKGLYSLQKIDPASKALSFIQVALVANCLLIPGYLLYFILTYLKLMQPLTLFLVIPELTGAVGMLCLIIGIERIGHYMSAEPVIKNARVALIFFAILYTGRFLFELLLLVPSIQVRINEMNRTSTMLSSIMPIYFSLSMIATIFYIKSLREIFKPTVAPKLSTSSSYSGISDSLSANQDFDFLKP